MLASRKPLPSSERSWIASSRLLRVARQRLFAGDQADRRRRAACCGRRGRAAGRAARGRARRRGGSGSCWRAGMSRPLSMIVVHSSTSASPCRKREHLLLELALRHLAVGHDELRLGHRLARATRANVPIVCTRLWTKKTCPPRRSSRRIASRISGVREAAHLGADREPVRRRRVDHREVAQARERELERARDRRRGQRQHVDGLLDLLDAAPCARRRSGAPRRRRAGRGRGTRRPSGAAGACRSRCRRRRRRAPRGICLARFGGVVKRESDSMRTGWPSKRLRKVSSCC